MTSRPTDSTAAAPSLADEDVLAVVIGRAGSTGLPDKNVRPVAGRPMVVHAIDHAMTARRVDHVIVSTDGRAIAEAARSRGMPVIDRPPALATATATVGATVRHAVETAGIDAGIVVVLYANVPVRPPDLIDRAIETLRSTGADSVQSYAPVGKSHPHWMVELDEGGRVRPHVEHAIDRRQDLPPLLLPDGGVIALRRTCLDLVTPDHPHAFLGADRRGIVTEPGAVVDVDGPLDLAVAEAILGGAAPRAGVA